MSIYIPGISVSCCLDCPCADPLQIDEDNMMWVCRAVQKGRRVAEKNLYEKQPWCPLIEVPPHGRFCVYDGLIVQNDAAPTIIPEDKDGDA